MKALGALAAVYAAEVQTTCELIKITRVDGMVVGFTSHDVAVTYAGVTYDPLGFSPTALESNSTLAVANAEAQLLIDSTIITETDVIAGKYDHAAIEILRVNWSSPTAHDLLISGWVGEIRLDQGRFTREVRSKMQLLQNNIGRVLEKDCDADLGDARCTVNLAAITVTGTVTAVASQSSFTDSARTEADGLFDFGAVTFTSGANSGLSMEVYAYSADTFTVRLPFPYPIQIGDTYSVYPGCDKIEATCKTKFSNFVNYRGFPHLVGLDGLLQGPA